MLNINDLCFSYTGNPPYILNNINIFIKKNTYVSILGKNGSCKSTLIKLIAGLLKPCKGNIKINTTNVGYVPQRGENFNSDFPITVYEILKYHMEALKLTDSLLIDKYLEYVGMLKFKNKLIGNLSGGQQQKVFIAKALIGNPELLLLDEPSTGIDIKSQSEIYSLIKKLHIEKNITVISIEHNIKAALNNSSHIIYLENACSNMYTIDEYKNLINKVQLA
ncbi:metal ABC transporter ATP-binding protein [Clostridium rectalis]|uniref:metal ABC transporter ATP-binding protein n=1 Tax=Clostridium rectalis TaxID=2040295 RepID=UPI000F63B0F6|nr:metal ABC transporter ATP-binding protein [Clostridium rectalis]